MELEFWEEEATPMTEEQWMLLGEMVRVAKYLKENSRGIDIDINDALNEIFWDLI